MRVIFSLIVAGVYFTNLGRKRWKLLNRLKKTITSNIANAQLGVPAEIKAKVFSFPGDLIVSPLTQTKGAAFIWEIDEWEIGITGRPEWHAYSKFHSIPFLYLKDAGPDLAGVDLEHVEFMEDVFTTIVEEINDISPEAKALIKNNDLMIISEEFPRKYRIKEKVFLPDEEFFIHGLCTEPPISYLHTILGEAKVGRRASYNEADGFSEKEYLAITRAFFRGKVYFSAKSEQEAKIKLLLTSILFLITGPLILLYGLYLLLSLFF